ncbi:MAG TPA: ACT domain-containing protein, partial [Thermomicrobiaceae bacterium]|nr:ACT domain-containing protein [Thermomicrobiaceae bacterium]
GRDVLERELRRLGVDAKFEDIAAHFPRYQKLDDFLAAVGYGAISPQQISSRLAETADREVLANPTISRAPAAAIGLRVSGIGDLYSRLGNCCKPVFGDEIIGYVTRGRGITVHRTDCHNIIHVDDPARLVQVSWGDERRQVYPVNIRLDAWDRVGLLRDITALVADEKMSMSTVLTKVNDDRTVTVLMTVEVDGIQQLSRVLQKLESIRDVYDVRRESSASGKLQA